MPATGTSAKKHSDYIPILKDQGIDYVSGNSRSGQVVLTSTYTFAAGGVVTFAALGLPNMLDGTYNLLLTNVTGAGAAKSARDGTRTAKQFVVTGPANGDVVEVTVIGSVAGGLVK